MLLSKSDYMLFLKHPAWLWLKKFDTSKLPPADENTQAIFNAGHLFENYAEQLFPDGVKLGFESYQEYLELPERTRTALKNNAKTIFQGRFEYGQLTFIADVVQSVDSNTLDLYEIKSSTGVKPDHEIDLAFQMVVLESIGYNVRNIYVAHINNQFIKSGEIDPYKFVTISEITQDVKAQRQFTKNNIDQALKVLGSPDMPDPSPANANPGSLKEWLQIYRGIKEIETESIYDLCALNAVILNNLESLGIKKLTEIPDSVLLSGKQQLQIQATKLNKTLIESNKIKEFLKALTYPLYFLDYETMASAVPQFDGLRPYQQLPFQYSLHIIDAPGATPRQVEYLHRDNQHPAETLTKSLISHIGTKGSILTWNAKFEMSCNTLLGTLLPEYQKFYEEVNARIVDLMHPFSTSLYVHKDFRGSASIKNVLPVLAPDLSYKKLVIKEGGSAQRLWMEAVLYGKREAEKEQILTDLQKYCHLDTLAMVRIYEHLNSIS